MSSQTVINKNQRVGIFIDIQNLYHSAKNLYQSRVNYQELIKEVLAGRQLIRALAYVVKSETAVAETARSEKFPEKPSSSDEASFFEALKKAGLELRVKDLQIYSGGMKKADWDVGLAVDAIRMANFLDVVILATGDGDFVPLVEYLKWGLGRQVEVAAFGRATSGRLKEAADYFLNIEEKPKIILTRKNQRIKTSIKNLWK